MDERCVKCENVVSHARVPESMMHTTAKMSSTLEKYIESMSKTHVVFEPLPDEIAHSLGDNPLEHVSDEILLTASSALLAHIIETAANRGTQVMSPENIPACEIIHRVSADQMQSDFMVAGSVAQKNAVWQTFDGLPVSINLVSDPFVSAFDEMSLRTDTSTVPAARFDIQDKNPVVSAISKAVGVVAIQEAPGVCGDSKALAALLERAWGLDEGKIDEFMLKSRTPADDLLRYAIGGSNSRPTAFMPIHLRQTISVAMGTVTRAEYGSNMAYDWNRARAVIEAIYYMSSRLEGKSLADLYYGIPPGNMTCGLKRPGILVFQPAPMSVTSYPAASFRSDMTMASVAKVNPTKMTKLLKDAVAHYDSVLARPTSEDASSL